MMGEECRMDSGLSCPCPSKAEWSGQQKAPQIWGYWGRAPFLLLFFLQIYGAMEVCPVRSKEASWRKLRSQARLACLEKSTLALCDGILP